jgi:multimeric flavodoxin WrbA
LNPLPFGDSIPSPHVCCTPRGIFRTGPTERYRQVSNGNEPNGILLGSPVYFTDVTAEMKALIDRCGLVSTANGGLFKRKVGAAVTVMRRAGAVRTFDTLNHLFLYNQMIIPGSTYWNVGIGRDPGEVKKDEEGLVNVS